MAIYFKFNEDGTVLVANNYFFPKMDNYEFYERCMVCDTEKFLSKYSEEEREILRTQIARLKEIKSKELSKIGPVIEFDDEGNYVIKACYVGDTLFKIFYTNKKLQQAALAYGRNFYGKEFMNQVIENGWLLEPTQEQIKELLQNGQIDKYAFTKFMSGQRVIDMEEHAKLCQERSELTQIRNAKTPLMKKVEYKSRVKR